MTNGNMKLAGYACLTLAAVLLVFGWERYSSNAQAVKMTNQIIDSSPIGEMMSKTMQDLTGKLRLEPSVPVETTYSILFAVVLGVAGVALLSSARRKQKPNVDHRN